MIHGAVAWVKRHMNYLTITPVLVTLAIVLASVIVGGVSSRSLDAVQTKAVDKQMRENTLLIQGTFNSYEQIIWSGVARINSAPIDRSMWSSFVNTYRLPEKYPAVSRFVVQKVLRPGERDLLLTSLSDQYGQPITVIQDTPDKSVNIIMFSSPEQSTTINNIGFNAYSNPNRFNTMQLATDENAVAMSDQTELILDAKNKQTIEGSAFLIYAPYYIQGMPIDTVEQRRAAIDGHVAASFNTEKVFSEIFKSTDKSHVSAKVWTHNGDEKTLVFASGDLADGSSKLLRSQTEKIFGQTFLIEYEFDRNFLVSRTQLNAPLFTALFGSIIGLLVGTVTFFFLRGRYHQLLLDKERDIARAKDELLSLASHQLRTPATGVKQYVGMVLQGFAGDISDNQKDLLSKAYESNERQLRVINDILHLAKLDMGRVVLAKTKFDMSELVKDVIDEQHQEIVAAQLKITTKLAKSAPVYADKHMLRMVIENLLSNAIKYTDPGGHIAVRVQCKDDGYYITIKDSGVGVSTADIPRLFKQFSRLHNSRSHLVTGTGVGLYLAKHLTILHGGDIAVESVESKGSSFVVFIPKNKQKL